MMTASRYCYSINVFFPLKDWRNCKICCPSTQMLRNAIYLALNLLMLNEFIEIKIRHIHFLSKSLKLIFKVFILLELPGIPINNYEFWPLIFKLASNVWAQACSSSSILNKNLRITALQHAMISHPVNDMIVLIHVFHFWFTHLLSSLFELRHYLVNIEVNWIWWL